MPSWYNLFFATSAVLALLRYRASMRVAWLDSPPGQLRASPLGSRVIGLYAVAGALLSFGFWATEAPPDFENRVRSRGSGWVVALVPCSIRGLSGLAGQGTTGFRRRDLPPPPDRPVVGRYSGEGSRQPPARRGDREPMILTLIPFPHGYGRCPAARLAALPAGQLGGRSGLWSSRARQPLQGDF